MFLTSKLLFRTTQVEGGGGSDITRVWRYMTHLRLKRPASFTTFCKILPINRTYLKTSSYDLGQLTADDSKHLQSFIVEITNSTK